MEKVTSNHPKLISVPDSAQRSLEDAHRVRSVSSSHQGLLLWRAAPATPNTSSFASIKQAGEQLAPLPYAIAVCFPGHQNREQASQKGPCCSDIRAGVLSREGATPPCGHVGRVPTPVRVSPCAWDRPTMLSLPHSAERGPKGQEPSPHTTHVQSETSGSSCTGAEAFPHEVTRQRGWRY